MFVVKLFTTISFQDAYTSIPHIEFIKSIEKLCEYCGWPIYKKELAKRLAKMISSNCYMKLPGVIVKQLTGVPMGVKYLISFSLSSFVSFPCFFIM